jgi:Mg2+/Co2+ transporter CorB
VIALALVALGLVVSAFFSAVETALVSANRTRLSHRADAGEAGAAHALRLLEEPRRLFGATLVGNTLANVFLITLATLWFDHRYGEHVVPWLVLVLTAVLLVAGEIVPKAIARAQADDLTVRLAGLLDAMVRVLAPLIGAVNGLSTGLVRLAGIRASPAPAALNRQEFQLLLDESEETGQVGAGQGRILSR